MLASFTATRIPALQGAPTMTEASGIKGLEVPVWVGLLVPAQTPQAVVDKLATELQAICALPETRERFTKLGATTTCGGPADLGKVIAISLQSGIESPVEVHLTGDPETKTESDLIRWFWAAFAKADGRSCGYNIIGFDLPYLLRRSFDLASRSQSNPNCPSFALNPLLI